MFCFVLVVSIRMLVWFVSVPEGFWEFGCGSKVAVCAIILSSRRFGACVIFCRIRRVTSRKVKSIVADHPTQNTTRHDTIRYDPILEGGAVQVVCVLIFVVVVRLVCCVCVRVCVVLLLVAYAVLLTLFCAILCQRQSSGDRSSSLFLSLSLSVYMCLFVCVSINLVVWLARFFPF